MKKYAILTSVLALTACATGGGSGGGSSSTARPAFDGGDLAKFIACKGDNCIKITSSETDQAKYAKKLSRAAITRQSITVNGEAGWEVHDMGDIPMNSLFGPNNPGKMKFNVNADGDIEGLQFSDTDWEYLPDRFKDPMTYIGSETFSLNSDTTSGSAHMNIDEAKNQGLQFSTFGTLEVRDFVWTKHDVGDGNMDIPFAGGYDAAKQNPSDLLAQSETKEYNGVASGMIEYAGTEVGKDQDYLNIRADDAKLIISTSGGNLKETLTASFKETDNQTKNWHNVTAIKDNTGIKFTFEGTPDNQKFSMRGDNNGTDNANIFNVGYYGSNRKIAEEATGLFQYQEKIDNDPQKDIEGNNKTMYFGFGGKVQK